ncbi:hypothetical protein Trydic_g22161 [Trypoxylus dichotomus]
MEMEEKLARYRAEKEREASINQSKERLKTLFSLPKHRNKQVIEKETVIDATVEEQEKLINESTNDDIHSITNDTNDVSCCSLMTVNPNEISAYSVFNKGCKSIDGTLKAEQFEREIRFGRGLLHV